MIDVLVVLLTLGTLGAATITWFRQQSLREALRDALRRLYVAQARLNELESTVQKELQALRSMVRRQSGGSLIQPTMKIAEAIALNPRTRDVLAEFHLGGCSSCAINEEETIAQTAMRYGIDLGRLMAALTTLSPGQEPRLEETQHGNLLQLTEF
jgi:hybrid cluster-associated redox disulfide protein